MKITLTKDDGSVVEFVEVAEPVVVDAEVVETPVVAEKPLETPVEVAPEEIKAEETAE